MNDKIYEHQDKIVRKKVNLLKKQTKEDKMSEMT